MFIWKYSEYQEGHQFFLRMREKRQHLTFYLDHQHFFPILRLFLPHTLWEMAADP